MIRVICVLSPQPTFDMTEEYVYRMQSGVEQYLPIPHEFCCLTPYNIPGVYCIPPITRYPGFWAKMEVFLATRAEFNLYLDLDTIVTGDLRPILARLATLPRGTLVGAEDEMYPGSLNSSVMAWQGDISYLHTLFATKFSNDPRSAVKPYLVNGACYGDQGFIQTNLITSPVFLGNLVASYKLAPTERKMEASVVFFHGQPRPHQVGWMPW